MIVMDNKPVKPSFFPLAGYKKRKISKRSYCSDCSEDRARETLERVMSQALLKARRRRSNVCAVCLAVAGVNHPVDQQRMLDWLRSV